jgi:hypothetical protein
MDGSGIATRLRMTPATAWVRTNASEGVMRLAVLWRWRGWMRAAGEMRLKAFASYQSAWQFAAQADGLHWEAGSRSRLLPSLTHELAP